MEIVTGSTGEVHVTPIDDAVRNGNVGYVNDRVVFTYLRNFEADDITNNKVRIYSGYGMNQGRLFKIDENDYDEVEIRNGSAGYKRADLIVARYTFNNNTGFEDISLAVVEGTSGSTYTDPSYTTGDINHGDTQDDMPLYRVKINGLQIEAIEPMFTLLPDGGRLGLFEEKLDSEFLTDLESEEPASFDGSEEVRIGVTGNLPLTHGGTGGNNAKTAMKNILIDSLETDSNALTDSSEIVTSEYNSGFSTKVFKRPLASLWSYIKSKIKALLGMGNTEIVSVSHGGTGKNSVTAGSVLVGNGTNAMTERNITTSLNGSTDLPTSKAVEDALGSAGYGDMMRSTYDPDMDGVIAKAQGGTGTTDGTINGVLLTKSGNTYGYMDGNTFKSFRQPTGNATAGDVLSGKTFANANSDAVTGTMTDYTNNKQTVTPTGGTGNETLALSAGKHNGVIVNRTAPYNAGVNTQKAVSWEDTAVIKGSVNSNSTISLKNVLKWKYSYSGATIPTFAYQIGTLPTFVYPDTYYTVPNNINEQLKINTSDGTTVTVTFYRQCQILH